MEITRGVHQVDGVMGNCYLVEQEGLVLIDTGLPRNAKKILACITGTLGRDPHDVHTIIITHYHADHTGNVATIRRATGAKVAVHPGDAEYLSGKRAGEPLRGIRGRILSLALLLMPAEHAEPDILLRDGDTIAGLHCIHVPGHTPGSVALFDPVRRVLFSGDALLTRGGIISGPPPSATPDMAQAMESAKKLAGMPYDILLTGHGTPLMPDASEKVAAFLAQHP